MIIKQQKGSFLLEFLIALGIFSVAVVGLIKLQNRALNDLGDLGADMAIPILISDFTARVNLSADGSINSKDEEELKKTAAALMKTITVSSNKITIADMADPSKKATYDVELDASRTQ